MSSTTAVVVWSKMLYNEGGTSQLNNSNFYSALNNDPTISNNSKVKDTIQFLIQEGLDDHLVANIVQYAKCLPRDGVADIDEPIFTAQMIRQFNLTNKHMISSLYRSLRYTMGKDVRLKDFCRCICSFLTADINLKSEFVFHVYDINGDGYLSYMELFKMVKTNVLVFQDETNDNEDDNPIKDLAEMAMKIMCINIDESLTSDKFRQLVERDSLCLDILGQVLPTSKDCEKFKDTISTLSPFQVHRMFQYERFNSLGEKKVMSVSCYPLIVTLP